MKLSPWIFGSVLLAATPVWSQSAGQPVPAMVGVDQSSDATDDRMTPPPPVTGQPFPIVLRSQERSNYVSGGVTFTSAYTDNAVVSAEGTPVSDISYSVAPRIALDQTTGRMHLSLSYAPGFTFYQREDGRNEADHNAGIHFEYRMTPHVTFSAGDTFQKSSSVFNSPDPLSAISVTGGTQGSQSLVVSPLADRLVNSGYLGLAYQYSLNSMVGLSGNFSNLHYSNPALVPGLGDNSSQGGGAYYAHRVSRINYFGVNYEFQRLVSYPSDGLDETQTHAIDFFYTIKPAEKFSISVSGGPQYSSSTQAGLPAPVNAWTPEIGASINWQGRFNSLALSYWHTISNGGGLTGAAETDSGNVVFRQQIMKRLSGTIGGAYTNNKAIAAALVTNNIGHSILGTAQLTQDFGEHFSVMLGYARIRQMYGQVEVLANTPDTNREFVSVSYQFSKAIGR